MSPVLKPGTEYSYIATNFQTRVKALMRIFHLKKGHEKRFKAGHPWVFSNEINDGLKNLTAGELVELRDHQDQFLARGYGNPHSLISFRELTRDAKITNPFSADFLLNLLTRAGEWREKLGMIQTSHRLIFGEADGFPGLIIDYYRASELQVFVIQPQTAGAEHVANTLKEVIEAYVNKFLQPLNKMDWELTAILLSQKSSIRALEGLPVANVSFLKKIPGWNGETLEIRTPHPPFGHPLSQGERGISIFTDLINGQKTGLFLDQAYNIALAKQWLQIFSGPNINILDLFCYNGQWGLQLALACQEKGMKPKVTLADASQKSLEIAQKNLEKYGIQNEVIRLDILEALEDLSRKKFSVVVCDPPALIKSRKSIHQGVQAYTKLNTQALSLVEKQGLFITCSCSGLLPEEEFSKILAKASLKSHKKLVQLAKGQQSPDHPVTASFPEGNYLKCTLARAG